LTEQIKENRAASLDDYHAVIEATVQRTRPVILTARAAVLAFIPLTHSAFWYLRIMPTADDINDASREEPERRAAIAAE
jgi:multidrug efflux pump subunit AcrB